MEIRRWMSVIEIRELTNSITQIRDQFSFKLNIIRIKVFHLYESMSV